MTKNRSAHILTRSGIALLLRCIGLANSFLFSFLLAHLLGSRGAGLYFLAATLVSLSTVLARFGLDNTLLRMGAVYAEAQEWAKLRALYKRSMTWVLTLGVILTCLLFASSQLLARYVFSETALTSLLQIMSLSIIPLSLLQLHAELLKSTRKIVAAILIQNVGVPLLGNLLLFLLVPILQNHGAALSSVIASSVVMLAALLVWRKNTPALYSTPCGTVDSKEILASSMPLFIVAIMNVIIDLSDSVLIGYFLNASAVGIYTIALRVTSISSVLLSSVNSVIAPEFSTLWANGKHQELNTLAQTTTRRMALIACVLLFCIVFFAEAILGIFGAEFIAGSTVLRVLGIAHFIALATGPVAYILMMTGNERFHRTTVVLCAISNIVLNCILIPLYGMTGAAIATAIALSTKNILAVLFVRQKLDIKVLI